MTTEAYKAVMPFIVPNESIEDFTTYVKDDYVLQHPGFPGLFLWIDKAVERLKLQNYTIFTIFVKDFRKIPED